MQLKTARQEQLIVNNVVRACRDITKLSNAGYNFLYLAVGFIAHYDRDRFICYYQDANQTTDLRTDILKNAFSNQWHNFHPGEKDYEYHMQKKRIYNAILDAE